MLPRAAESLDEAHAAIELWEFYKRRRLDGPQRLTVEVMMATRADGRWAASTTAREMPRQNGKGDEIEVVELWGLVQRAERILHTVHDAVLLATETQSRMLSMIEGHADLRRLKERAWRGTGQQMIEMRNGGTIWYRTRTGGGGRGVDDVDRIVVDEAQHAEAEHLAAITPTQLVSANPQLNALGSAGIAGKSVWWWQQRRLALSAEPDEDFGYVGHTAETVSLDAEGRVMRMSVDVNDRRYWYIANPALSRPNSIVGEPFFESQLRTLGAALFAREHLGVWDPEPDDSGIGSALSWPHWIASAENGVKVDGQLRPASPLVNGGWASLQVSPGMSAATLGFAGVREDGLLHVEIVRHEPGTGWVVEACKRATADTGRPLVVDPKSATAGLLDRLREAGVPLLELSSSEFVQACAALQDDVLNGRVKHLDQGPLNASVTGADIRPVGEAWAFSARASTVDISPLLAVTLAAQPARQGSKPPLIFAY